MRVLIPTVVTSPSTGAAVGGATVTITRHYDGTTPPTYPDQASASNGDGGSGLTTDQYGRVTRAGASVWIDTGTYDLSVTGAGLTGIVLTREMVSARPDDVAANPSLRTLGTGGQQAMAGNDARVVGAAPLLSPAFTGSPTAPTLAAGDATTRLATTSYAMTVGSMALVGVNAPQTAIPFSDNVVFTAGTITLPAGALPNTRVRIFNATGNWCTVVPGSGDSIYCYGTWGTLSLKPFGQVELHHDASTAWYVDSPLAGLLHGVTVQIPTGTAGYAYSSWVTLTNGGLPSDYPISTTLPVPASVCPVELGWSFYYTQGSNSGDPGGAVRFSTGSGGIDGQQFDCPTTGVAFGNYRHKVVIQRTTSLAAGPYQFWPQMYATGGGAAYNDFYLAGMDANHLMQWWVKQVPS